MIIDQQEDLRPIVPSADPRDKSRRGAQASSGQLDLLLIDKLVEAVGGHYVSLMSFDLTEFQIRTHEKIIGHYRELLDSGGPGLSVKLRDEMLVRLVEEERQLALLLQKQRPGR